MKPSVSLWVALVALAVALGSLVVAVNLRGDLERERQTVKCLNNRAKVHAVLPDLPPLLGSC